MTDERVHVSRETEAALREFLGHLLHWNRKINLVAGSDPSSVWSRHVLDSVQLWDLAPATWTTWLDLGSGGGFPGLVVALLARERNPAGAVALVESDSRKAAFLSNAIGKFGLNATVHCRRIEALPPWRHDVVSARALAPLSRLAGYARPFGGPGTIYLLPKGSRVDAELTEARRHWHIVLDRIPSRTDQDGTILRVRELEPLP